MKTIIVSKLKVLALLFLLVAGVIIAPNAYVMPSELCVFNSKHSVLNMRLRARLVYIDKNRIHQQKGDIYSEDYISVPKAANKCLNTSQIVTLFRAKGLGDNDYYLTKVRVDVKSRADCQLSGDKAVHSWIGAPKTEKVNFDMRYNGLWYSCKLLGS